MKVLVYGYGLMGKKVAHAVMNDADLELVGVVSPVFDVQPEVPAYKSLDEVQYDIDAIIDFSHPANLDSILAYALKNKCKVVFATTGFSAEDLKKIEEASHEIALFQSYNTSYGVAMMNKMVSEFAKEFFEHRFDIEIMEKHHNQKIDSPSGTAVMLYDGINNALDDSLEPTYDRHSIHRKRERNEVGISSIRGGTIFGEHTVMFAGQDEIVEVKHTALSKEVFANGAVAALKALMNKDKGLFDLKTLY